MAVLVLLSGAAAAVTALPPPASAATTPTTPAYAYDASEHPAVPNDVEMASRLRSLAVAGMESVLGVSPRFAAEGDTPNCPYNSFTADTAVTMADGTEKAIDKVKVGDKVLSTDPATGRESAATVTKIWVNHDTDLMDVTVSAHGKTSIIHATQLHPFWDTTTDTWVQAEDLRPGDALLSSDGSNVTVVSTRIIPGARDMWDLTVQTTHDFYVVTLSANVLVHNCGESEGSAPRDVHGQLQADSRSIDVQYVNANGDLYVQDDGQLVRVLDNGNGTSDVVIRDPANPSGEPTTAMQVPDSYVESKLKNGAWSSHG